MSQVQNLDRFLENIANRLGRNRKTTGVQRPNWKHQPQWKVLENHTLDELVDVMEKQCQSIHTDFFRTTKEELPNTLIEVIEKYNGKRIITWDDERFESYRIQPVLNQADSTQVFTWDTTNPEKSIEFAEIADIGITFSDITLAESGTVVLFNGKGRGRSVSLLPKALIVIIPKSTIVPRMSQATKEIQRRIEKGERISSCINFITGPSNSADIEMNLVVGVHGPIYTAYIIVD